MYLKTIDFLHSNRSLSIKQMALLTGYSLTFIYQSIIPLIGE